MGGAKALELWSVGRTLGCVSVIAVLAVALGLPAGWLLRRRAPALVALGLVPLLMPTYLVYSGWGLLRGPGTWVGDALGRAPPAVSVGVNQVLAIVGMALWAWPIAALVIGLAARRVPGVLLDALAMEPASAWQRIRMLLAMLRSGVIGAFGVVAVVMTGSAIPLHLAQVRTYAIDLWTVLSLTPDIRGVWLRAVPLLAVAIVGGVVLRRVVSRRLPSVEMGDDGQTPRMPRLAGVLAGVVWMLSVCVPLVLFAAMLKHTASIWEFWHFAGSAVLRSVAVSACVGVGVGIIAMLAFASGSMRLRGMSGVLLSAASAGLIACTLVPGMLVGVAGQGFWNAPWMPSPVYSSIVPLAWAHVARFGGVGVLVGLWLSRRESEDERAARELIAGDGLHAWWVIRGRPVLGIIVGVACAAAALSLHEIEAAVTLQAPGPTSVAQYLLDKLHYARDEQLCAACLNLLGIGVLLAGAAAVLIARAQELGRSRATRAA